MQGRVLLIASEAGLRVLPHMLHYSITKTAQIALAEVCFIIWPMSQLTDKVTTSWQRRQKVGLQRRPQAER